MTVAAAAVVILSAGVITGVRTLDRTGLDAAFAAELEQHHLRSFSRTPACEFESADPGAVESWVERNLGYRVEVPAIRGARLLGARRCVLEGQPTAHLLYRSGDRALTVYVPASGSQAHGAAVRFARNRPRCEKGPLGEALCVVPAGQMQVAVSEIAAPQLLSMVARSD
jgi:anti-sigma factor RsiW